MNNTISELPALYTLKNSDNKCKKDQPTPPYLEFSVDNLNGALDALMDRSGNTDPVIFYVHGRAAGKVEEPDKSLRSVLPCLENENNAKVVMFYWPGAGNGGVTGFPEKEARQAGKALGQVVSGFQEYKEMNSAQFRDRKAVLLLHSMGNLVFEEFVDNNQPASIKKDLFDTVILSSSANATKDHARWLKKTRFSENIYVMVNKKDPVLDKAGMKEMKGRLGKKLKTIFAGKVNLADNAIYVNFDKAGIDGHRYFTNSGQKGNLDVENFFDKVLTGQSVVLDEFSGVNDVDHRDGTKIYFFKKH